jgi:hypothetical protein
METWNGYNSSSAINACPFTGISKDSHPAISKAVTQAMPSPEDDFSH